MWTLSWRSGLPKSTFCYTQHGGYPTVCRTMNTRPYVGRWIPDRMPDDGYPTVCRTMDTWPYVRWWSSELSVVTLEMTTSSGRRHIYWVFKFIIAWMSYMLIGVFKKWIEPKLLSNLFYCHSEFYSAFGPTLSFSGRSDHNCLGHKYKCVHHAREDRPASPAWHMQWLNLAWNRNLRTDGLNN